MVMLHKIRRWWDPREGLPDSDQLEGWTAQPPVRWFSLRTMARSIKGLLWVRFRSSGAPATVPRRYDLKPDGDVGPNDHVDPIRVDYVADLGDGFRGAYTTLLDMRAKSPSDVLILGGDQVYPAPSAKHKEYENRLLGPLMTAFPEDGEPSRKLFSIPGNHDYYDGLEQYSKLLLRSHDEHPGRFGDFALDQKGTNWVLAIGNGWAILGVDFGEPSSELPTTVVDGFRQKLKEIQGGSDQPLPRCVVVVATPAWLYGGDHKAAAPLASFEDALVGVAQIEIVVAGDRHCYLHHQLIESRTASHRPMHRITSGAGGSFLHMPKVEPQYPQFNNDRYVATASNPTGGFWARMRATNPVNFLLKNPGFNRDMTLLALLGALAAWHFAAEFSNLGFSELFSAAYSSSPGRFVLVALFFLGLGHKLPADVTGFPMRAWRLLFAGIFAVIIAFSGVCYMTLALLIGTPSWLTIVIAAIIGGPILVLAEGVVLWFYAAMGVSATSVYGGAGRHSDRSWMRLTFTANKVTVVVHHIADSCDRWEVDTNQVPIVMPPADFTFERSEIETFTAGERAQPSDSQPERADPEVEQR